MKVIANHALDPRIKLVAKGGSGKGLPNQKIMEGLLKRKGKDDTIADIALKGNKQEGMK